MFTKQTIKDIDLKNKTVLLRADYNVPVKDGKITDDYRIKQSLPTIKYLLDQNVKLIICSHLGRPDGKANEEFSLFPVAKRLKELVDKDVGFATDCIGGPAEKAAGSIKNGQILLLENLRFHAEEEANDNGFAQKLASLAEVFVQDGFGVVHRAHASTEAITHHLPSVAGLLLEKEVGTITTVMESPEKPLMAIIGGAKIADKIEILKRFINIADFVAVGGAMANTFLAAQSIKVGASLYDKDQLPLAKKILKLAEEETKKRGFIFALPQDSVVATKIDKTAHTRVVEFSSHALADVTHYPKRPPASASQLSGHEKILDIGPVSAAFIAGAIPMVKTVVWNGTMGVTEIQGLQGPIGPFSQGTQTVVDALLGEFGPKPFTVVGGGDTVGYVESKRLVSSFAHVSTGGGASLELMSGKALPGVEALMNKN
jgi:3-phosphoglycerate kinase